MLQMICIPHLPLFAICCHLCFSLHSPVAVPQPTWHAAMEGFPCWLFHVICSPPSKFCLLISSQLRSSLGAKIPTATQSILSSFYRALTTLKNSMHCYICILICILFIWTILLSSNTNIRGDVFCASFVNCHMSTA